MPRPVTSRSHIVPAVLAALIAGVTVTGVWAAVDLRRARYFSSMGFAALFKLVKQAKERQRPVKFCNLHPDVRVGAEILGLNQVVEIHHSEKSALEAFGRG